MYRGVMDQIEHGYKFSDIGSKVAILPTSHIEGPQYMKTRKQDAFALV